MHPLFMRRPSPVFGSPDSSFQGGVDSHVHPIGVTAGVA